MVKMYNKTDTTPFSEHFSIQEFNCPCFSCKITLIDTDLIDALESLRIGLGTPITVTSGYRCDAHQKELAEQGYETAKGVSQHTLGKAADIRDGIHSGLELEVLARQAGFKAVGVGGLWVHVDTRNDKIRRWEYRR